MTAGTEVESSVSQRLAGWLADLSPDDVPAAVRAAVTDTVIDVFGLCLAARGTDYVKAALAAWEGEGPCTVLGAAASLDPAGAALVNGTAAHGEDFDNTFEGCPVHSGAVIVPAVLAVAEKAHLDGAAAMTAMAAGMELMCRLGLVARKGMHAAGFHPTAIAGAMAATAAVAAALRLTPKATVDAFGVAGSMAGGIIEYLADGSWTKRMHAGWAAQAGIRAARMGAAGFMGPRTVFEGEHGLFRAFAPSLEPDFTLLTGELGARWEAERVAFKPFACGTMTQPYIDCAIALRADGVGPDDIAAIVCDVGEGTVHRLWEPLALKQRPPNAYAAKFSTPYCIAVGLIDGDAGLRQFTDERTADPEVRALASKVRYRIDPLNEYPANYSGHLQAVLTDGRKVENRQPTLRGGVRQPLARDELVAKFRSNARFGGVPDDAAERLLRFAMDLEGEADLARLGTIAGRGGR